MDNLFTLIEQYRVHQGLPDFGAVVGFFVFAPRPAIKGGGHVVGGVLKLSKLAFGLAGGAVLIIGISRPLSFF